MQIELWTWFAAASPLAVLAAFALAFLVVLLLLQQLRPDAAGPSASGRLDTIREKLGVDGLPLWFFLLASVIWLVILLMLLAGVMLVLWTVLTQSPPQDDAAAWDFRFLLAQLAAVTTVLGVVVAFPVTLNRLRLTAEDNNTKAAALYNDKINAALAGLHARKQVTAWKRGQGHKEIWQDDIVRRNGAIDRLEALAHENPQEAPRIARMLATYLRELSAVYPPEEPPAGATPEAMHDWADNLEPARSDMENAAQTLGRLLEVEGMTRETLIIDLHGANLQSFQLGETRLEGANLRDARLEGADLEGARLEGANLRGARLEGAILFEAHLEGADLSKACLVGAILSEARLRGAYLFETRLEAANLRGAWLEGAYLREARLEGAILFGARLEGAYLNGALLERAVLAEAHFSESTIFTAAKLLCAAVKTVDVKMLDLTEDQINAMFGDGSVILPDGIDSPAHWPRDALGFYDFGKEWALYKSDPAAYVPPQDR